MPRRSSEDRAAAVWRASGKPPRPPEVMSADAKRLWRKVVHSREFDYFDAAAQEQLAEYCELCITQRLNLDMLRRDPADEKWQRCAARLQPVINSLSVKLRLSPSSVLAKRDGKLDEKEIDVGADDKVVLFGRNTK